MCINEDYVYTLEEIEAQLKACEERWKAAEEREARKKARRLEREAEKAAELGLTVEQYKAKKNHERKVKEAKNRIAKLEAELAEAKKYLEKLEG